MRRRAAIRWGKRAVRVAVLALVTWGVARTVLSAREDFARAEFRLAEARPVWLAAAAGFYLAGLVPCWAFWYLILKRMRQSPHVIESLRAYFVGHLGKYVPGKAMVVVLRTGLLDRRRVDVSVAAASVVVETLTMMAVGALIAALILLLLAGSRHGWLTALAVCLMLVAGVPTLPPVLKRIVRVTQVNRLSASLDGAIDRIDLPLLARGWGAMAAGWLLLGLSLWATLSALPAATGAAPAVPLADLPLIVACVALAMVAGFLSLIPGGLGVREWIVMSLMEPAYGSAVALVSAVLLRVVWLAVELLAAGALHAGSARAGAAATTNVTSADCEPPNPRAAD